MLEALASGACAADLQKLLRVTPFFFQPVVKKEGPLRGSDNICEMRGEVKLALHGVGNAYRLSPGAVEEDRMTTVFLADDTPAMRERGQRVLEEAGYRVVVFANGDELLAALGRPFSLFACAEREADVAEIAFGFLFIFRARCDGDGEAENVLRIFVRRLGEYRVLLESDGDVAHLIDGARLQAAEVLHARQDDVDELVEERLHSATAKRYLIPGGVASAYFEVRDGLLRGARGWSLPRDAGEPIRDELKLLFVLERAHTRRDDDFRYLRDLHDIDVAGGTLEGLKILLLCCDSCIHRLLVVSLSNYFTFWPLLTATRSRLPSVRTILMRVGFPVFGSTSMTLDAWRGIGFSTICPERFCAEGLR